MKKKTVHKKIAKKNNPYTQYLLVGFLIVIILFIAAASYRSLKNAHILGDSISLTNETPEPNSNSDANKTPEPRNNEAALNTGTARTPEPKEIHTPEPKEIHTPEPRFVNPQLNSIINKLPPQKVEIQIESHKSSINAAAQGTHVELKTEDNGSVSFKAKQADGTEIQLETHALDNINEALKENDIEIGTTSAKGFSITNKYTKAETQFPVTINLATKILSVDTPLGQRDLTVLPNQAVQNVLGEKIINRVSDSSLSGSADAQLQLVELKLFGNKPVFQVQGVDDKKFLGIIPVGIQKTTLVSAETGQIVKTTEDFVNKILDIFSFK